MYRQLYVIEVYREVLHTPLFRVEYVEMFNLFDLNKKTLKGEYLFYFKYFVYLSSSIYLRLPSLNFQQDPLEARSAISNK